MEKVGEKLHCAIRKPTPPARVPTVNADASALLECPTYCTQAFKRYVGNAFQHTVVALDMFPRPMRGACADGTVTCPHLEPGLCLNISSRLWVPQLK
eukprot:8024833-Pyramimonas_sp.AAC.1